MSMHTNDARRYEALTKASHSAAFLRDDLKEATSFIGGDPTMQVELVRLKNQVAYIAHRLSRLVAAIESEEPQSETIRCDLCGKTIQPVDAAIEAGWIPSYFDGEEEIMQAVCPVCVQTRLDVELNLIRKPEQSGSPSISPDRPSEGLPEDGTTGTPTERL